MPNEEQKQLTEKEAWLWLAELWKNSKIINTYSRIVLRSIPNQEQYASGLCRSIQFLKEQNLIDNSIENLMKIKISNYTHSSIYHDSKPNPFYPYIFPRNPEGAKQRVQFCLDRANEL